MEFSRGVMPINFLFHAHFLDKSFILSFGFLNDILSYFLKFQLSSWCVLNSFHMTQQKVCWISQRLRSMKSPPKILA